MAPPTSEYHVELFHSSSKTEDRSQDPSGVLQKLDRPDMLIMVASATSFVLDRTRYLKLHVLSLHLTASSLIALRGEGSAMKSHFCRAKVTNVKV